MIKPIVEICVVSEKMRYDQVMQHQRTATSNAGSFAMDLARSMAIAGVPLPECDGAGHQMMRLLTPDEIVTKAITITELLFSAMEKKNWVAEVPTFSSLLRDEFDDVGFRSKHG